MCVFLLFWEKNKQEKSRVSISKFNQGCLLFFEGRRKNTFFESFLDPQISFARIL